MSGKMAIEFFDVGMVVLKKFVGIYLRETQERFERFERFEQQKRPYHRK
jgi:hypothetical protein